MAKTKTAAKKAKATQQGKKKTPDIEKRDNRYLRAARIILAVGEDIALDALASKAEMSKSTAGHCMEAFKGVCLALREANRLPARKADAKPVTAPQETPEALEAA
jgi:hypothetical protein